MSDIDPNVLEFAKQQYAASLFQTAVMVRIQVYCQYCRTDRATRASLPGAWPTRNSSEKTEEVGRTNSSVGPLLPALRFGLASTSLSVFWQCQYCAYSLIGWW